MSEALAVLESHVKNVGGIVESGYDELVRKVSKLATENLALKEQEQVVFQLRNERDLLQKKNKGLEARLSRIRQELEGVEVGSQGVNRNAENVISVAPPAPTVQKAKPAKVRRSSKRFELSAKETERRRIQGQYIGRLNRFSEDERVVYKELAKTYSLSEVIVVMDSDFAKKNGKTTASGRSKKTPVKRVSRKAKTAKPNSNAADPKRVALQVTLLEAKHKHGNGTIPRDLAEKFAEENGMTIQSINSLLATTQKSFREGFLKRVVAVAPSVKKAREDIVSFVPYYKTSAIELLREAGLINN